MSAEVVAELFRQIIKRNGLERLYEECLEWLTYCWLAAGKIEPYGQVLILAGKRLFEQSADDASKKLLNELEVFERYTLYAALASRCASVLCGVKTDDKDPLGLRCINVEHIVQLAYPTRRNDLGELEKQLAKITRQITSMASSAT